MARALVLQDSRTGRSGRTDRTRGLYEARTSASPNLSVVRFGYVLARSLALGSLIATPHRFENIRLPETSYDVIAIRLNTRSLSFSSSN